MKKLFLFLSVIFMLTLASCGGSGSDSQSEKASEVPVEYRPKTINYSGTNYKRFRKAAEKVITEYRDEILTAVHQENWELVQRELMDYWELLDNMTPSQTGSIWENEQYQNAYDNFAAKVIIEEARMLLNKKDTSADEILLELIMTIQPLKWSVVDNGKYSHSSGETVMQKVKHTIVNLARLKGRTKVLEFFGESLTDNNDNFNDYSSSEANEDEDINIETESN